MEAFRRIRRSALWSSLWGRPLLRSLLLLILSCMLLYGSFLLYNRIFPYAGNREGLCDRCGAFAAWRANGRARFCAAHEVPFILVSACMFAGMALLALGALFSGWILLRESARSFGALGGAVLMAATLFPLTYVIARILVPSHLAAFVFLEVCLVSFLWTACFGKDWKEILRFWFSNLWILILLVILAVLFVTQLVYWIFVGYSWW